MAISGIRATGVFPSIDASHAMVGVALGLAVASPVSAAQPLRAVPTCPASIMTRQDSAAPNGWTVERVAMSKPLAEIGFFQGPVRDRVQLAPSGETTIGKRSVAIWTFDKQDKGVRLACLYRGTDIVLTRSLPSGISECRVTTDPKSPIVPGDALRCR